MGSLYGTHEIVELKDEPNLIDHSKRYHQTRPKEEEKKPKGCSRYLEDDINKLFEGINIRTSFNGSSFSDETSGATPRKNPSKKPMRMSTSSYSGIGYSNSPNPEPVSLKQALRGLCISQASEMAAMKRQSMPPGSPALSDSGKLADFYKSVVKARESGSSTISEDKDFEIRNQESTSKIPGKIPRNTRESKLKSYTNSTQSSPRPNLEKSTKSVRPPPKLNEILREPESAIPSEVKVVKSTQKSRLKGKSTRTSPRPVKTVVIRNKTLVKKKLTSATPAPKSAPEPTICQKCHCAMKDTKVNSDSPISNSHNNTITLLSNNKNSRFKDKGEFTQSSNSSICEYSSSTSISEDRNLSGCSIIINRPHMSKDIRWQAISHMMKQDGFLGLGHFNLLKKLGCGDIGTVYLAELIGTNYPFAIKIMDNEFLERRQKMPRAHMEREILSILDHPFLPTLYAHFVSENLSCLVMEYCPGGDLHVLRQKQPARFFHEQAARFYVAEVLLALEYLHMLGIVYRDLKPENILVREDGHIMVTDFDLSLRCSVNPILLQSSPSSGPTEPPRISGPCAGSSCIDPFCMKPTCQVTCFRPRKGKKSKKPDLILRRNLPQLVAEPVDARSNSFVGTHEYLAPEIIKGEGHGSAVDWWTFGIFLYELLYGRTPFKGPGNDQTLANVVLESLRFPETPLVSFQARDLIKGLLVKEPENRLGSQRGAAEIKQHPFFEGLNWALIRCASPPELPEAYDVAVAKSASLEKAKKYLDYNGGSGGHLEFELF